MVHFYIVNFGIKKQHLHQNWWQWQKISVARYDENNMKKWQTFVEKKCREDSDSDWICVQCTIVRPVILSNNNDIKIHTHLSNGTDRERKRQRDSVLHIEHTIYLYIEILITMHAHWYSAKSPKRLSDGEMKLRTAAKRRRGGSRGRRSNEQNKTKNK